MRKDIKVEEDGDQRILRSWLADHLPEIPAKGIRRAIQRGQITIDGRRTSSNELLLKGQTVNVHIQDKFNVDYNITGLKVLFEDQHLAGLFKPAGIEVHGNQGPVLMGAVKNLITASTEPDALLNPAILHRLDKPTCGVLLVAKTRKALKSLSQQFQSHSIIKEYLAIVHGSLEQEVTIKTPIDGKSALSRVIPSPEIKQTIIEFGMVATVLPKTGRKHQIRKHLSSQGHPIAGDKTYGKKNDGANQLLLCAHRIAFTHPNNSPQEILCDIPDYFGLK